MLLTTHDGRRLDVTDEVDEAFSRVVYRVAGVGAFTIEQDPYGYAHGRDYCLTVHYGARTGDRWVSGYDALPEAPRLFGVTLGGGATFAPERADGAASYPSWLACHRQATRIGCGGGSVPDGTHRRAAQIVAALVEHHMAREDREALDAGQARRLAPSRLADHQRDIADLTSRIDALAADRAALMARADAQAALLPQEVPQVA